MCVRCISTALRVRTPQIDIHLCMCLRFSRKMIHSVFLTVQLGCCRIHGKCNIAAHLIPGFLHGTLQTCKHFSRTGKIRCKSAFIPHCRQFAFFLQNFFQKMINFRTHPECIRKRLGSDRYNHKFLKIQVILCVRSAIYDIHHRHRPFFCIRSSQITVQRHIQCCRCAARTG